MPAIEIKGLEHSYRTHLWNRPKVALDHLDLVVEEGQIFGYLGANGAGKTTTIKILVGLTRQSGGEARIFDIPVNDIRSRAQLGFMPENPYFYEYLSARESMLFYAGLSDVPGAERAKRSDELLEFIGLKDAADTRVKEFSKGMRQRLGIAQALVNNPRLVILDEPMSGLDPVGRLQVREAILSLKEKGMTVFFSSHVLGDVEMICDQAGLLMHGSIQALGPIEKLLADSSVTFELLAKGLSAELSEKLSGTALSTTQPSADEILFSFETREAADEAVENIVTGGGKLLSLKPERESLEEFFMRKTGQTRAEVGSWSGGADK